MSGTPQADIEAKAIQVADRVEPDYRAKAFSCTSHSAKRWQAAYDAALIVLSEPTPPSTRACLFAPTVLSAEALGCSNGGIAIWKGAEKCALSTERHDDAFRHGTVDDAHLSFIRDVRSHTALHDNARARSSRSRQMPNETRNIGQEGVPVHSTPTEGGR
jgi:hypothetical protein